MKVRKRDGRIVDFNSEKIIRAVLMSFKNTDGEITPYARTKAQNIAEYIASLGEKVFDVEQIQDLVEKGLMSCKRKDVAKAYILYRENRRKERDKKSNLIKTIKSKIMADNVQNQNANVDEHSFGGRMGEANDALMRQYALDYCLSEMALYNHLNNEIYIHDIGHYAIGDHNCLSIPFDILLAKGFKTRQTTVRPANSVNTAFQLLAVIFQLQSLQQFGGCSATHLDWTMIPYVRKSFYKHFIDGMTFIEGRDPDKGIHSDMPIDSSDYKHMSGVAHNYAMEMTRRELKQAVEGMYHNLNTLQSRSGN